MNSSNAQTDLLFSILALQNKFVSRDQLIAALNLWAIDKKRPLAEIVCQQGAIDANDQNLLERLVQRQMEVHGDVEASLCEHVATMDLAEHCSQIDDFELREQLKSAVDRGANSQMTIVRPSVKSSSAAADSITQPPPSSGRSHSANLTGDSSQAEGRSDASPSSSSDLEATADSRPLSEAVKRRASGTSVSSERLSESEQAIRASRFSIVNSHAKGGLGEVFLARDNELDREVALKEIQRKFSTNEEARLRFEFEACITGGLEHPGVVPVYAYGKYPDGRPFYAMRFIRGRSMKDEIADYHKKIEAGASADPLRLVLRGLLTRFVDACQAIAYAHSRGVVHRDLKPANIMLGKYGETLVVDWGLAKSIGRDEYHYDPDEDTLMPTSGSSDSGTMQGSTLGTPGYMSPEQANGKLNEMGPASDIFSLGATLYCILIGKAPFEGKKASEIVEKASQNRFIEPIKQLSSISKPLNSIVMKCMATEPQQRYHTALELAHDVEAFLSDDIVTAYGENHLEQAQRWIRRHRTLATAAFVLISTLGLAATTAAVLINSEKNKTKLAYQQVSEEQRKTAQALAALTIEQETTRQALAAETRARRQTREMLDTISDDLVGEMMGQQVALTETNQRFFDRVLQQFEQFTETGDATGEVTAEARNLKSDGFFRVANLQRRLNRFEASQAAYQQAIDSWRQLSDQYPSNPNYRYDLATAQANLGLVFAAQSDFTTALDLYRSAAERLSDLLAMIESDRVTGDNDRQDAGSSAQTAAGQDVADTTFVSTQPSLENQVSKERIQLELARLHGNLANTYVQLNRTSEAEPFYRLALDGFADHSVNSMDAQATADRARTIGNYAGLVGRDPARLEEARSLLEEAVDVLSGDSIDGTSTLPISIRFDRTIYLKNLSRVLVGTGQTDSAIQRTQAAVTELQGLANEYPAIIDYRRELAANQVTLANLIRETNPEQASREFQSAIGSFQRMIDEQPRQTRTKRELAASLDNWGQWLVESDSAEGADFFNQARALRLELWQALPGNPTLRDEWFIGENNFANLQRTQKQYHGAIPIYQQLLQSLEEDEDPDDDPLYSAKLHAVRFGLADSFSRSDQYQQAMPLWQELTANPSHPNHKIFQLQLAICQIRTGTIEEGLKLGQEVVQQHPTDGLLLFDMACCYAIAHEMLQPKRGDQENQTGEDRELAGDADAEVAKVVIDRKVDQAAAERYAQEAIRHLYLAADAKFFADEKMRQHAMGDNDLKSLTERQDFQEFSQKYLTSH